MLAISCRWKRLRVVLMMYLLWLCSHHVFANRRALITHRQLIGTVQIYLCASGKKNGHKWISNLVAPLPHVDMRVMRECILTI